MKVILLMALTLDGKIGRANDHLVDWTSPADKQLFRSQTKKSGVLIMGNKTYQTIGRPLPGRLNVVMTGNPENYKNQEDLIFTKKTPSEILLELSQKNYQEVVLGGGAVINTLWAKEGLIDEIMLTINPVIFGTGLNLFSEELDFKLELKDFKKIDEETLLVHYKVLK